MLHKSIHEIKSRTWYGHTHPPAMQNWMWICIEKSRLCLYELVKPDCKFYLAASVHFLPSEPFFSNARDKWNSVVFVFKRFTTVWTKWNYKCSSNSFVSTYLRKHTPDCVLKMMNWKFKKGKLTNLLVGTGLFSFDSISESSVSRQLNISKFSISENLG